MLPGVWHWHMPAHIHQGPENSTWLHQRDYSFRQQASGSPVRTGRKKSHTWVHMLGPRELSSTPPTPDQPTFTLPYNPFTTSQLKWSYRITNTGLNEQYESAYLFGTSHCNTCHSPPINETKPKISWRSSSSYFAVRKEMADEICPFLLFQKFEWGKLSCLWKRLMLFVLSLYCHSHYSCAAPGMKLRACRLRYDMKYFDIWYFILTNALASVIPADLCHLKLRSNQWNI